MATFATAWAATEDPVGQQLTSAYTAGTLTNIPLGAAITAQETEGVDPVLGEGQFLYAKATAGINAGNVVQLSAAATNPGSGSSYVAELTATNWAGTANSGACLAVALATLTTGQYGWFQTQGLALVNTNGTATAGSPVYWQAAGVVSSTVVASKQMQGATFVIASGANLGNSVNGVTPTVGSNQAIVWINEPSAQDAIS